MTRREEAEILDYLCRLPFAHCYLPSAISNVAPARRSLLLVEHRAVVVTQGRVELRSTKLQCRIVNAFAQVWLGGSGKNE